MADAKPYGDLLGAKYARAISKLEPAKNKIEMTDLIFAIFDELIPPERLQMQGNARVTPSGGYVSGVGRRRPQAGRPRGAAPITGNKNQGSRVNTDSQRHKPYPRNPAKVLRHDRL